MRDMKASKTKLLISLVLILIAFVSIIKGSLNISNTNKIIPTAKHGVLDLRNWDFQKDGMLRLNGQWEFYDNQILFPKDFNNTIGKEMKYLSIPGIFNEHGYGTYRLKLLFNHEEDLYSIKVDFIQSAYKLWANNLEVIEVGTVGKNKNDMIPQLIPKSGSFHVENGEIYLTLQVSNFYNKYGFIDTILLGNSTQIKTYGDKKLAFDLFLFGCSIIAAIYNLGIFYRRKRDKAPLYFAIVCIIVALRTVFIGEGFLMSLLPNIGYILSCKIKVLTFYIYIPFIILFINHTYDELLPNTIMKISNYSAILYTGLVLIFPFGAYLQYIIPFEIFALVMLTYMMYKISKIYFQKDESDYIAILGLFALFISRVNDILYEYSIIITGSFAALGIFIFILANFFVLAKRQAIAFSMVEEMSEELKSLNQLKDEFLAVTSHELKTPLNGIIGLSEGLASNNFSDLSHDEKSDLNLINSSAKRLSNLVNDMLIYSSLKNNEIKLNKKPVNINKIVDMVIKFSGAFNNNKKVSIMNLLNNDTPYVYGDEDRIQQIFYNLIGNAVKFTHEGDISIFYCVKGDYLEIYVEDKGIGIPEDKIMKIFDLYEQVEGISEKYGGTGLGLYTTKKLVELHGGTISVTSEVNKGSKFIFTLPLYTAENIEVCIDYKALEDMDDSMNKNKFSKNSRTIALKRKNQIYKSLEINPSNSFRFDESINNNEDLESNNAKQYKILIVDDEYVNQKVLKNYLSMDKFLILEAYSGKEALEIVEDNKDIDLVILDMMMPDLLGVEVCKIIRQKHSIYELPILIMTADNRLQNLVMSFESGANDYLKKPFNNYEFSSRVSTLLTLRHSVRNALRLTQEVAVANEQVETLSLSNKKSSKRVEELLEYDKVKTEFFANISHELRTPLNVISSTIQLLQSLEGSRNLNDERIKYYFSIMNQNSFRLLRLINNLIDTTKIEGGYINLNLRNGDIIYTIEEISQSVAEYIKTHEITLVFDTEIEEKIMAFDEEKIERIILNILSNSIKFTPKDGSIFVNIYDKVEFIEIVIRDTGIGIPKEKLDFIFERFAQIDKSITRQNEGSGIGLALVKSLVDMHGGEIYAKSEINQGSEFIITLPVRTVAPEIEEKNITNKEVPKIKLEGNLSLEFSDIYIK
jgi:two-component system, sensor histidine kinase ChiS